MKTPKTKRGILGLIALAWLGVTLAWPAQASEQKLIETSAMCTQHFGRLERQYGIPKHLLMAVGGTESGRWSNEVKMAVPWPWTINAEGKGQYFDTMHDAVAAVRRLQQQGVKSIDIGCMQVNLKHHPKAFASITQAFDPAYNTTYAAKFLRGNYDETKSWSAAVAAYHSRTPMRGRQYFSRVKHNWKRVLAAVRGEKFDDLPYVARGGEGAELEELSTGELMVPEGSSGSLKRTRAGKEQAAAQTYRSPTMKIITVSEQSSQAPRRDGVLVIRPETSGNEDSGVEVASNTAVTAPAPSLESEFVTGAGIKRPVAERAPVSGGDGEPSSRRKGPNFIFN